MLVILLPRLSELIIRPHEKLQAGTPHGQKSLAGDSPRVRKRVGQDLTTKRQQQQSAEVAAALPRADNAGELTRLSQRNHGCNSKCAFLWHVCSSEIQMGCNQGLEIFITIIRDIFNFIHHTTQFDWAQH